MVPIRLTPHDHRRDIAGLTYVYPVVSRRAGGISIGINLNPNNACNWRCLYCQVEGLKRGAAPEIDWSRLQEELSFLARSLERGEFFRRFEVPPELRELRDVAISGNGEPTTYRPFSRAVREILSALGKSPLLAQLPKTLISNGSLVERPDVQEGLRLWGEAGGVLWFKVDRVVPEAVREINGVSLSRERISKRLEMAAACCPTWIQSCFFLLDGRPPETQSYLHFLRGLKAPIEGVQLYGVARPPRQPGGERISPLPAEWFEALAREIRGLGYRVEVAP